MTDTRARRAAESARAVRRTEQLALQWIYESDTDAVADLARRTLAQAVGLRRLLDQIAGHVSAHDKENPL